MWCDVVWCDVAWRGVVWCGVAWRGVAWRCVALCVVCDACGVRVVCVLCGFCVVCVSRVVAAAAPRRASASQRGADVVHPHFTFPKSSAGNMTAGTTTWITT